MNRRDISRLTSAIGDCISAETTLGRIRPGDELSAGEFLELVDIKKEIQAQRRKLQVILKR